MDFEKWYAELVSDQIWFEPASMHHRPETFRKTANRVYMQCIADGLFKPMGECRKHVYNIICKTPGDRPKEKPWYEKALEAKIKEDSKEEEWQPVTGEEREEWLRKWQEQVSSSQMVTAVPRLTAKQIIEEGDWRAVSTKEKRNELVRATILQEHIQKVNEARAKVFKTAYPDASQKEVEAYLKKFDSI